jgi:hypothetical protein
MKPNHDGALAVVPYGRGPDIQDQTILALRQVPDESLRAADGVRTGLINQSAQLGAERTEITGVAYASPRFHGLRRQKTAPSSRWSAVRNAFKDQSVRLGNSANSTSRRFDYDVSHESSFLYLAITQAKHLSKYG